jgi:outer membrane protein TolC
MTLREVIKSQKETNKYLAQSLKVSKRKYKQARISLQELIGEQDSHLQSQLQEIDSNLAIVNTLIDYFSIYMDTPCEFNRI